ncbi:MAG: hypothetical protein AAFQ43_03735 [Bacteroidota bacterium]
MTRTQRQATQLLLQLAVVIVGVTISLVLDEWRASRGEARDARVLTASLSSDLRADIEELDTAIGRSQQMAKAYRRLLAPEAADLPNDSLDVYVDLAVSYAVFPAHDEAYEAMRQTGTSGLLRDPDLRSAVIRHYTRAHGRAREWDDINRQFVLDRMIPYIEANAPELSSTATSTEPGSLAWTGLANAFRALDEEPHFRNLLQTNLLFKEAQVTVYTLTREATETLLDQLNSR